MDKEKEGRRNKGDRFGVSLVYTVTCVTGRRGKPDGVRSKGREGRRERGRKEKRERARKRKRGGKKIENNITK